MQLLMAVPPLLGVGRIIVPGHDGFAVTETQGDAFATETIVFDQLACQSPRTQVGKLPKWRGAVPLAIAQACWSSAVDIATAVLNLVRVTSDEGTKAAVALRFDIVVVQSRVCDRNNVVEYEIGRVEA
jgi:hypothetical protein